MSKRYMGNSYTEKMGALEYTHEGVVKQGRGGE